MNALACLFGWRYIFRQIWLLEQGEFFYMAETKKTKKTIGRAVIEYMHGSRQSEVAILEGDTFKVGTGPKNEIRFNAEKDPEADEHHCTLLCYDKKWYIVPEADLKVWVNENEVRTKYCELANGDMVFLGTPIGPAFRVFGQTEIVVSRRTLAMLLQRGGRQGRMVNAAAALVAEEMGTQKKEVRRALFRLKRRENKKLKWVVLALVMSAIFGISGIVFQANKIQNLRFIAEDLFYKMKGAEVTIAQLDLQGKDAASARAQLASFKKSYDGYLEELEFENGLGDYENKLILKMARVFGECELRIPEDFTRIVKSYIKKWQSTSRLRQSIAMAKEKKFTYKIIDELLKEKLPPHFFYIALQESNFDTTKCGPKTRVGIAKGMWQFMPATALQYGLKIGPLANVRLTDPLDERHNSAKSTAAAVRYLKRIYSTEAQASGLLVLASYNYGENRVRGLIREMEENPEKRNFWQLMTRRNLPKQTRDYVFYIFSAAVIGEDPEYFGFSFSNPISQAIEEHTISVGQ